MTHNEVPVREDIWTEITMDGALNLLTDCKKTFAIKVVDDHVWCTILEFEETVKGEDMLDRLVDKFGKGRMGDWSDNRSAL